MIQYNLFQHDPDNAGEIEQVATIFCEIPICLNEILTLVGMKTILPGSLRHINKPGVYKVTSMPNRMFTEGGRENVSKIMVRKLEDVPCGDSWAFVSYWQQDGDSII